MTITIKCNNNIQMIIKVMSSEYQEGMSQLTDMKKMRKSLAKSKLCMSVINKKPCPHGNKCRYAHHVDELQVPKCFFGDACNRVEKTTCGYKNRRRICNFIHPSESKEMYYKRMCISP